MKFSLNKYKRIVGSGKYWDSVSNEWSNEFSRLNLDWRHLPAKTTTAMVKLLKNKEIFLDLVKDGKII